ncbi:MAG: single-stranded DNA-binding protein [Bacteroidales bacterium]|nr:single-stranded DNA-binding protein [Bacteroidales bacterium]
MAGVNRVILIGNLGKDPEVRTIENGVKVAKFPLATTEVYRDRSGNKNDQTEWHNIVMWRGLADIAEKFLSKGKQVYIEGRIKTRSWEDKDGNKRYITEIVADNMTMLGGRRDDEAPAVDTGNHAPDQDAVSQAETPTPDDDLPF